ncbi:MAG: hypothetical protein M1817_003009 [Caeruleum heppii]|nr:MAG: hypothetical protein M1817_003009 [Caeruleum heppii]
MAAETPTQAMRDDATDLFKRISSNYERSTGGCTRELARYLVELSPPIKEPSKILDNACGTGIVTEEIFQHATPRQVPPTAHTFHAVDVAPPMISNVQASSAARGWTNVHAEVMDAHDLTFPDDTFALSYTNLGILFCAEPVRAATHVYRTLAPGGTAYLTTWSQLGYLPHLRAIEKTVRPDLPRWKLPIADPWFTAEYLREVLEKGGFSADQIEITTKEVNFSGPNAAELAETIGKTFSFVMHGWTDEDKTKFVPVFLENMSEEEQREARFKMVAFVAVAKK